MISLRKINSILIIIVVLMPAYHAFMNTLLYKEKFYPHCLKTLSCEDVCPMKIPTQRAISKMNRKSIWRLMQLIDKDK